MLSPYLEELLARHCAPTLLGAKTASLVSVSVPQVKDLDGQIRFCNVRFGPSGLAFRRLYSCRERVLLLIYRPVLLRARLEEPQVERLLSCFGYPPGSTMEEKLELLQSRLTEEKRFPHEIGLFLDYPVGDVLGFIRNQGEGGKLCRYWKVYGDVAAAQERFACYDACRCCLQTLLAAGKTISQLFSPEGRLFRSAGA